MAVASGGGHWVELRRIMPAFDGCDTIWVSTETAPDADLAPARYYAITNVTRRDRLSFLRIVSELVVILRRERPEVVVSTGAAPGMLAIALAKLLCRSRTVWIDTSCSENAWATRLIASVEFFVKTISVSDGAPMNAATFVRAPS